jgi:hypothetical protein
MFERKRFEDFINPVLEEGFDRFCTVGYPAPPCGEESEAWNARADKAARNWVGRIMLSAGTRDYRHVRVTEERPDGSFWFHVLFGGCDWTKVADRIWLHGWWLRYNEKAYERHLDHERIGGLLRYFVMQLDCPIWVFTSEVNGTYRREDFRQWIPKAHLVGR